MKDRLYFHLINLDAFLSYVRLEELQVLDIKFLYGCLRPTIVVLYQVCSSFNLSCSVYTNTKSKSSGTSIELHQSQITSLMVNMSFLYLYVPLLIILDWTK